MRSSREEIEADFDALDAALARISEHSYDALTTPELLGLLERRERVERQLPVSGHALINQLKHQASPAELGGTLSHALADRLRITRGEAKKRIDVAADLGTRRALTGEPLAPRLAATAAAQRAGEAGAGHIAVVRRFLEHLPGWVDAATREQAETDLAKLAAHYRPDQVRQWAELLTCYLNPDGDFTDHDRARRRGLTLGKQDSDGMSRLSGWLTPEARATLEAVWAKTAAPGVGNPDDQTPVVDGPADEKAARRDTRTPAQRQHDGLTAALRGLLASGKLGQHNGLPASIVITTTLGDLEAATGKGLTAGGTLLPMSDVIRLARHAHHYLAIFDHGKPLALYHTKRLASPAQRIVLYAKERGCSAPGCTTGGYHCEVHHVQDWATTHRTDINQLTLACGPHHKILDNGWTTRKNTRGETQWIPPPHLDHGQPRTNTYHHPDKLHAEQEGDEDGDEP